MNPLREKSAFSFPPLTAKTGIKRTSHFTARTNNHWLGIKNVVYITFLNDNPNGRGQVKTRNEITVLAEKKEKRKNERKKGTLGRRFS